jgi:hypothetical protein
MLSSWCEYEDFEWCEYDDFACATYFVVTATGCTPFQAREMTTGCFAPRCVRPALHGLYQSSCLKRERDGYRERQLHIQHCMGLSAHSRTVTLIQLIYARENVRGAFDIVATHAHTLPRAPLANLVLDCLSPTPAQLPGPRQGSMLGDGTGTWNLLTVCNDLNGRRESTEPEHGTWNPKPWNLSGL